MGAEWKEVSQDVLRIADALIAQYHEDLQDARIGFIFRSEASTSAGKTVWAKASKVDAKTKALMELQGEAYDFLIWIAEPIWHSINGDQRQALIDHELCHCRAIEDQFEIVGHDIEEFQCVIDRWGLWNTPLLAMGRAVQKAVQLELGFETRRSGGVMSVNPGVLSEVGA